MNKGWVGALIVVLLQGCAGVESPTAAETAALSVQSHENALHARWAGRDYEELIAEWGKPIHEMTIPRYGWPNSSALLYGLDETTGCIDAFLIVRSEGRVWVEDYFCR